MDHPLDRLDFIRYVMNGDTLNRPHLPVDTNESKRYTMDKLHYIFEKKFKYNQFSKWTLPPMTEPCHQHHDFSNLQFLKRSLNEVKSKLNNFNIEEWSMHTKKQDPTSSIPYKIKQVFNVEFPTVAWCKFYECVNQYALAKSGTLNSLHLCEAPGAFVTSLNHYLHSTYDEVQWNWLATTLNPYYEGNPLSRMIIDDRFIVQTMDHWVFYEDFTGNIMNSAHIRELITACEQRLGEVHLITADGSINCMESPGDQELSVMSLHYSEICAALMILAKGGNFLLKMFTLFESLSVDLMYLLNCVFEEVHVFKPATSKRGNSEVYTICLGYKKSEQTQDFVNTMLSKVDSFNISSIFSQDHLPKDFLMQHEVCCRRFMYEQINAIESNILAYTTRTRHDDKLLYEIRPAVIEMYFEQYKLKKIPTEKRIVQAPLSPVRGEDKVHLNRGSYSDRQNEMQSDRRYRIRVLLRSLNDIESDMLWIDDDIGCFRRVPGEKVQLHVVPAKSLDQIFSSRFITPAIFQLRTRVGTLFRIDPLYHCNPHCLLEYDSTKESWKVGIENNMTKDIGAKQRQFFMKIFELMLEHKPNRITFVNVPFLTHYSVSILRYMAANIYDTCAIKGNRKIVLEAEESLTEASMRKAHELYQAICADVEVSSFMRISELQYKGFAKAVRIFNDQLIIANYKMRINS